METEILTQILDELRQIRQDLQWFREREERKQQAVREMTEDAVKQLIGHDAQNSMTTKERARALAAFIKRTEKEK